MQKKRRRRKKEDYNFTIPVPPHKRNPFMTFATPSPSPPCFPHHLVFSPIQPLQKYQDSKYFTSQQPAKAVSEPVPTRPMNPPIPSSCHLLERGYGGIKSHSKVVSRVNRGCRSIVFVKPSYSNAWKQASHRS
ncbi:hypothetical protein ACMFMF_002862 [Clarireedia jacksonii]